MDDLLTSIRAFVSGEIPPLEFRERLYSDERFQAFLENDPQLSASNYVGGSTYIFLLEQDLEDVGGVLNAQGALCEFMDRNGFSYECTPRYEDLFNLILGSQPAWLDDQRYVSRCLLPHAGERKGKELKEWLTAQLKERFRYVKKPPRWIQSPAWPIAGDRPLVFLGQLKLENYLHDTAAVYVFHDPQTGEFRNVIQVM